jgi:phosphatidylserine/phosphatidylglycerophosphate/cardiolipin synthase-like enzyme
VIKIPFKTDGGGLAIKADIKVSSAASASTWNTRLSQIQHSCNEIFICTYSLPNLEYLERILDKRSARITILANSKFVDKAYELKKSYPDLKIKLAPDTHAKIVLIYPNTVWLSSANFGRSGWFENTVGIKNKDVYNFYENEIKRFISGSKIEEI